MGNAIRWTQDQLDDFERRRRPGRRSTDLAPAAPAKYRNVKTTVDGITHDSAKEARRWAQLEMMQAAGIISELRRQVKFELIPKQKRADGKTERPCSYVVDFCYCIDGKRVVEDVKGIRTRDYIIKRKLMLLIHGIEVMET